MKNLRWLLLGGLALLGCKKKVMMPDGPMALSVSFEDKSGKVPFVENPVTLTGTSEDASLKVEGRYVCEFRGKVSEEVVPGFTTFVPSSGGCRSAFQANDVCKSTLEPESSMIAWRLPTGSDTSLAIETPQTIETRTPPKSVCDTKGDGHITVRFKNGPGGPAKGQRR